VFSIRRCLADERQAVLSIVNVAAEAYRDVIPADRWHDPYMPSRELDAEIAAGVDFWGYEDDGWLVGVMGIQPVLDVHLIRHAYVLPSQQRLGVGGALLSHIRPLSTRRMLVGTWAAADWAIRFYQRHGFALLEPERGASLLRSYWAIPDRQIETSVVLESRPLADA
jgi:GNAT superfamily N-acetyltransferase